MITLLAHLAAAETPTLATLETAAAAAAAVFATCEREPGQCDLDLLADAAYNRALLTWIRDFAIDREAVAVVRRLDPDRYHVLPTELHDDEGPIPAWLGLDAGGPPTASQRASVGPAEVRAGLWAIDAPGPELDDTAFIALAEVIGDAEIVGLGLSRNGVAGYGEARARIVRWLVETQGFRLVAIDCPWTWDRPSRFVATGEGTADEAVLTLFPAWHDSGTKRMLGWLAAWNRAHPDDPVRLMGVDPRASPDDMPTILRHLHGPDEAWVRLADLTLKFGREWNAISSDGTRMRPDLVPLLGKGLADTLERVREAAAPGARTVLLTDNRTIMRRGSDLDGVNAGEVLAERFGEDWVSIGLVGRQVDGRGSGWELNDGRRDIEQLLSEVVDSPAALVSLRNAEWLQGLWRVGWDLVVPVEQFDALLFLRHATAADNAVFDGSPADRADAVRGGPGDFEAVHRTPGTPGDQEQLWSEYATWLASRGFEPVTRRFHAPWNVVKWQRFEDDAGRSAYLEIRRPAGREEWRVMAWTNRRDPA